jgi:hypothetical protein
MYFGESAYYNDEVRFEQAQADQKAAWAWRFRNVGRKGVLVTWAARVLAAIAGALDRAEKTLLAASRRIDGVRGRPTRTLLGQR